MSHYSRGDVILAPIRIGNESVRKVRPAAVLGSDAGGPLIVCPISCESPFDAACVPIALEDFESGGLEIFGESYLLVSVRCAIRTGEVVGKKGRLRKEVVERVSPERQENKKGS